MGNSKDKRPLRIAYGRIFHEGNSFSPLKTEREQFEDFHFFEGEELAELIRDDRHELVDILKKAELTGFTESAQRAGGVECVPLISALAVPNGPISESCFAWLRDKLRKSIEAAGEIDGIYLALHGSMRVEGLDQAPEGVIISDLREQLGELPIAISYDLHANLSPDIVEPTTILEGYRTNPHRDLCKTGRRAGEQLIAALREEIEPVRAWRKLPVILGGGMTIDFLQPMRPIFRHIKKLCARPDVVSAHLFVVHPFTDAPDLGWAVHVCTNGDQQLADRLADELADMAFEIRRTPLPEFRSVTDALEDLRSSRIARALGHVALVDTCDIVGAGSTGGNTHILDVLVREGTDLKVLLPLHDPAAVEALASREVGEEVEVCLRGTAGLEAQPEVSISALLERRQTTDFGTTLVLRVGELRIAVTEEPPGAIHPKFWRSLGLSPWKADAIVQKFFFHYRIFYAATVRKNIPVVSAGPSSLDEVRHRNFELPVWPQQPVGEWRSFDQARRASL
jgi:microcystin degradation protein MlrC